jgi:hypothetical protein
MEAKESIRRLRVLVKLREPHTKPWWIWGLLTDISKLSQQEIARPILDMTPAVYFGHESRYYITYGI